MLAVRPSYLATQSSAERLSVATRAAVVGAAGDGAMPALTVAIDDDLQLDWATEAIVLRILQEAVTHRDGRHVTCLDVAVTPTATGCASTCRRRRRATGRSPRSGRRAGDDPLVRGPGRGRARRRAAPRRASPSAPCSGTSRRQQRPPQLRVV